MRKSHWQKNHGELMNLYTQKVQFIPSHVEQVNLAEVVEV